MHLHSFAWVLISLIYANAAFIFVYGLKNTKKKSEDIKFEKWEHKRYGLKTWKASMKICNKWRELYKFEGGNWWCDFQTLTVCWSGRKFSWFAMNAEICGKNSSISKDNSLHLHLDGLAATSLFLFFVAARTIYPLMMATINLWRFRFYIHRQYVVCRGLAVNSGGSSRAVVSTSIIMRLQFSQSNLEFNRFKTKPASFIVF